MTELVYVLALEARFWEFESPLGHQIFYAPLVKWILHNATNVEVGVWFSQGAPGLKWDFSWYGYSGGLKNRWSWFDSNRSYQCPCGQIGKVISLKRRSSLSSNLREGTKCFLCAFSKMDITQRYERWSGSSILSGRTKLWKCGRVWFMATVLKTVEQKCSVSSNLTASANV